MRFIAFLMFLVPMFSFGAEKSVTLSPEAVMQLQALISNLQQQAAEARGSAAYWFRKYEESRKKECTKS